MRKVIATLFTSLDGVVEAPEKWSFPYWNEHIAKFKLAETFASGAMLLGRTTYEAFAAAWPSRTDPDGFADCMNSMPKYVVSNTLSEPLGWNNSHRVTGDIAAAVRALKQEPGKDILIHGSPSLVRFLFTQDLIDEYHLLTYPVVLGSGKRMFQDDVKGKLKLTDAITFGEVVGLIYQSAGAPE
jgi:dihydrofolate reductase